jgi:translation initiation factor IF-3
VTIMFRGREMAHTDLGRKILDRLVVDLADMVVVEAMPKQEGRNMIMVISPSRRWLDDLAKQRRADERATARDAVPIADAQPADDDLAEPDLAAIDPADAEPEGTDAAETGPAEAGSADTEPADATVEAKAAADDAS